MESGQIECEGCSLEAAMQSPQWQEDFYLCDFCKSILYCAYDAEHGRAGLHAAFDRFFDDVKQLQSAGKPILPALDGIRRELGVIE